MALRHCFRQLSSHDDDEVPRVFSEMLVVFVYSCVALEGCRCVSLKIEQGFPPGVT